MLLVRRTGTGYLLALQARPRCLRREAVQNKEYRYVEMDLGLPKTDGAVAFDTASDVEPLGQWFLGAVEKDTGMMAQGACLPLGAKVPQSIISDLGY